MFEQHQTQGGNGGGDRDSGGDVVAAALHVTGSHMLRAAREKAAMLCSCAFHACLLLMAKYTVRLCMSLEQHEYHFPL